MLWQINGDARHTPLRDASVQCVVTSPPYWGLRDYKTQQQIGIETTPDEYVGTLVAVFREVWRVLKKDGVVFLNLGDSYAGSMKGMGANEVAFGGEKQQTNAGSIGIGRPNWSGVGLKPKNLVGIPWRVAFALQAEGWYLRSDIIWAKPNPMPESVTDRPTRSHEYLFLLTKSARYYYDARAIATLAAPSSLTRWSQDIEAQAGSVRGNGGVKSNGTMKAVGGPVREDKQRGHSRRHAGFNARLDAMTKAEQQGGGANARSVWWIATSGTSAAHFATFPDALVRPCLLAGSRPGDLVCDPFAGTGTVGRVAVNHGRRAVMIDLNCQYLRLDPRKYRVQIGMGL